jgi:hypothetical protein
MHGQQLLGALARAENQAAAKGCARRLPRPMHPEFPLHDFPNLPVFVSNN